jgi:hypothetical protein
MYMHILLMVLLIVDGFLNCWTSNNLIIPRFLTHIICLVVNMLISYIILKSSVKEAKISESTRLRDSTSVIRQSSVKLSESDIESYQDSERASLVSD